MLKQLKKSYKDAMLGKKFASLINPDVIYSSDKEKVLGEVNIIKKEIYGTTKGRTCENGSKKIQYLIEVESVESLTVSLEALFITLIIDTYKERYVTTFDATGAYLHAKMPEGKKFLLKLRGRFYIPCVI